MGDGGRAQGRNQNPSLGLGMLYRELAPKLKLDGVKARHREERRAWSQALPWGPRPTGG